MKLMPILKYRRNREFLKETYYIYEESITQFKELYQDIKNEGMRYLIKIFNKEDLE